LRINRTFFGRTSNKRKVFLTLINNLSKTLRMSENQTETSTLHNMESLVQTSLNNRSAKRMNYKKGNDANRIGSEMRNFAGETPELDAVFGFMSEWLDKGVTFELFQEKLKTYAMKNLKKAEDIIPLIMEIRDPRPDLITNHFLANLTTEEATSIAQMKR